MWERSVGLKTTLLLALQACSLWASEIKIVVPTGDVFIWEANPTLNYGAAGALAVSGPAATNGNGVPQGRYDTMIKFNTATVVSELDNSFGVGGWTIQSVRLELTEVAIPMSDRFNQGTGDFEVKWFSDDGWVEGPGRPNDNHVAQGNEMSWNLLQLMLAAATEQSLGIFTYTAPPITGPGGVIDSSGVTALRLEYGLGLGAMFVDDLMAGSDVSMRLTATTDTVGFIFDSTKNEGAALVIETIEIPEPAAYILLLTGGVISLPQRRTTRR